MKIRSASLVFVVAVLLAVGPLLSPVEAEQATRLATFSFEHADIQTVIKAVGSFTGITFLYDPETVKGKITLLSPKGVLPAEALELLKSTLALHGYSLLSRAEGMWIISEVRAFKVVRLTYARAGEVAYTLSWIAPPGVRIVPYYPTNSLVISGPPTVVEQLMDVIKPPAQD